jgi:hypothetical protein
MAKELLGCPGWAWLVSGIEERIRVLSEEVVFLEGLTTDERLRKSAAAKELREWLAYPEKQRRAAGKTLEACAAKVTVD